MNEEPRIVWIGRLLLVLITASPVAAEEVSVTGIRAVHRHGQTFVTWQDAAEGEDGAKFRYSLYSSNAPITADNLAQAELCFRGVLNNSAKLYGSAFTGTDRLDSSKPYAILVEGGRPLPAWSGLAVRTVQRTGKTYYAVVATDQQFKMLGAIVPGENATTQPLDEQPAAIQPIKLYDSANREGPYARNTAITGTKGLPLKLTLHGSQANGGGAGGYGDYFLFFGTPQMGYRDGLAGVFSVTESRLNSGNKLLLQARDAVEHPFKLRAMETYWFGYHCVPQASAHTEPRVYPFTENQLLWIVRWAVEHYGADPNRVTVGGSSSGAVGSFNVGLRHPELFAAVYPVSGRVRRVPPIEWGERRPKGSPTTMSDGVTDYYDRVDGPKFVAEHHGDLPFVGWACGRHDGWATWQENIDMVRAMTAAKHGFAFSWNNGGHGDGHAAMRAVEKYYSAEKFARNVSYPAFGNSSLDDDMGDGDPAAGDLEGGINLGFDWQDVTDEPNIWSVALSNELVKTEMTVDVTPRRCQRFQPRPGDKLSWTSSTGDQGAVVADAHGLVTISQVKLRSGKATVLTIQP
jgi:hypothetical protein